MSVNCRKYLPKIKQNIDYIKLFELSKQYHLVSKISFTVTYRFYKNVKIDSKHITIMKIISFYIHRISSYFVPNKIVPRNSRVRVHKW